MIYLFVGLGLLGYYIYNEINAETIRDIKEIYNSTDSIQKRKYLIRMETIDGGGPLTKLSKNITNIRHRINYRISSVYYTIQTIVYYKLEKVKDKILNAPGHLSEHHSVISYYTGSKKYKIIIKRKKVNSPQNIISVLCHEGKDITKEIITYAGPNEDFHDQIITPGMIGHKRIVISFMNNEGMIERKIFDEDTTISLGLGAPP